MSVPTQLPAYPPRTGSQLPSSTPPRPIVLRARPRRQSSAARLHSDPAPVATWRVNVILGQRDLWPACNGLRQSFGFSAAATSKVMGFKYAVRVFQCTAYIVDRIFCFSMIFAAEHTQEGIRVLGFRFSCRTSGPHCAEHYSFCASLQPSPPPLRISSVAPRRALCRPHPVCMPPALRSPGRTQPWIMNESCTRALQGKQFWERLL